MKTIGYIRVSTIDQDTEKNKEDVIKFARDRGFGDSVEFVTEKVSGAKSWRKRRLKGVVDDLTKDDILIVPELSRIGRSLIEVLEVLEVLSNKGVRVYSVKEGFQLNGNDMQSKMMRTFIGLFAELDRDLIRMRTKEGMEAARAKGKKFGTPENLSDEVRQYAWSQRRKFANEAKENRHAWHFIAPLRDGEGLSYAKIAKRLNAEGYKTRTGKQFNAMTVYNIYKRFNGKETTQ